MMVLLEMQNKADLPKKENVDAVNVLNVPQKNPTRLCLPKHPTPHC
jgi:hypothetical protein